eukprot:12460433-Heterocapsa_arctica.AAC.1
MQHNTQQHNNTILYYTILYYAIKAKQSQFHNIEKTNINNARQVTIEEEADFKDKIDTEDNGNGVLEHIEEKDRPNM